ncbi:MAG: DUF1294 domain-containing protein [Anaeroplasmataceae bacterium]|nr:DUF1294 domain-containing protein [Anaeroplasmataceae bacterium]
MEIQFASLILSLSSLTNKEKIIFILGIIECIMSILTFLLYKIDKKRAKKRQWRIKEAILLLFPWLMGGIGGFMGIYTVRHKTHHWYFPLNNMLALIAQASLFISLLIIL